MNRVALFTLLAFALPAALTASPAAADETSPVSGERCGSRCV